VPALSLRAKGSTADGNGRFAHCVEGVVSRSGAPLANSKLESPIVIG
jgi:hypothetical protein